MGTKKTKFPLNVGGVMPPPSQLKEYCSINNRHLAGHHDPPVEYGFWKSKQPLDNPEIMRHKQASSFIKIIPPLSNEPKKDAAILQFTADDSGNADRFEAYHGNNVRYNTDTGKWFIFDGRHWHLDNQIKVKQMAEEVATLYRDTAATLAMSSRDEDRLIYTHSRQSCNVNRLNAMLDMLKHRVGVRQNDFDQFSDKLVVANGIIDLRTGLLGAFDSNLLLTQFVDVPYDPDAFRGSLFSDFVSSICCDDALLESYLQRAFGYGITGETREQVLFLEHGDGSNGKTTLNEAIANVMHDFVHHIPIQTLLSVNDTRSGGRATPELAQAVNARLLFASECEEFEHLQESMVKQLTGESVISVRHLYCEPFEFRPSFKIFLDTNHLPKIRGHDFAIWRRLKVIPFQATFTEAEKDITLPARLQQADEKAAILAWLVEGAKRYYRDGLEDVPSVVQATARYAEKEDSIRPFLKQCVWANTDSVCAASALYEAYLHFCMETNRAPENQTIFGRTLSANGYQKKRQASGTAYLGVRLRESDE